MEENVQGKEDTGGTHEMGGPGGALRRATTGAQRSKGAQRREVAQQHDDDTTTPRVRWCEGARWQEGHDAAKGPKQQREESPEESPNDARGPRKSERGTTTPAGTTMQGDHNDTKGHEYASEHKDTGR